MRPKRTKLDYDPGNITYQCFPRHLLESDEYCVGFFSGTGEEIMDPDKSVVFAYDGVPAHLDLAIPAPHTQLMVSPSISLKRI